MLAILLVTASLLNSLVLPSVSAQDVCYVRPDESAPAACPGQPCLTLDQYTQQAETYFTTGATFLFLPGNHSLQGTVSLVNYSNITLEDSNSSSNIIYRNKNAAFRLTDVTNFTINRLTFLFFHNTTQLHLSAWELSHCKGILIVNSSFQGSGRLELAKRAMDIEWSVATIVSCLFEGNTADSGGAIFASSSNLTLIGNMFVRNRAEDTGGAIHCYWCNIDIFTTHVTRDVLYNGSALFYNNQASSYGGAMCLLFSNTTFNGMNVQKIEFSNNTASYGGAIAFSDCNITALHLSFIQNFASRGGAVLYSRHRHSSTRPRFHSSFMLSGNFTNNRALEGGALLMKEATDANFTNITATGNSIGAFYISKSTVKFNGITNFTSNSGKFGGGLYTEDSILSIANSVRFINNTAIFGGGIYSISSEITFQMKWVGSNTFRNNVANNDGGAIYATNTKIKFRNTVVFFIFNSAVNGGAIYLKSRGTLIAEGPNDAKFSIHKNYASGYGGGIYYEDDPTFLQCNFTNDYYNIPRCFMNSWDSLLHSTKSNLAGKEGNFIYGGLLDRCKTEEGDYLFNSIKGDRGSINIMSRPYQLCFCDDTQEYNCYEVKHMVTHRGQTLRVFVVALDQMRNSVATKVTARVSNTARLSLNQSTQSLLRNCSPITYNLYSTESQLQLVLYPDGPCHDTGQATAVVNVTLLPCPDGLSESEGKCICEERLRVYDVQCTIDDSTVFNYSITRKAGSKFWMNGLYVNGTYQGLIMRTCPFGYCTNNTVNVTLDNPDTQCAHNRGGVLCGQCTANYSLTLGSDHCQVCSNAYLALLLPFAAAGVALVVFLTFLRLTAATGMINSVILYANIVQVNQNLFISSNTRNIITVFLAWMNLDLGFKTCFYDGMDAYAQTWLQFAFPVYVWTLIALIIVTSRYSITVSRFIGSNPIAVLATLLLMSYTKILTIAIKVFSSVKLDYPDNKTVIVWLRDANVPYLQSKHLLLTVVTSLVLVFLILPYTLLLLFGHKLYCFTDRRYFQWLSKIKPLLDSYYAPYKMHTRYWTGFLLLVRCVLYIVFAYHSLGATDKYKSLLAISITFAGVFLFVGKVYSSFYTSLIAASTYLNLVLLSAATLAGVNSPALVYTLVGTVFATMIGIIVYHFHLLYTAKSAMWLKVKVMLGSALAAVKNRTFHRDIQQPAPVETGVPAKPVSKTVIELREPLLENN